MTESTRLRLSRAIRLLLILDETKIPHLTAILLGVIVGGTGAVFLWSPQVFLEHPSFRFVALTTGLKIWGLIFLALGVATFAVALRHYRETAPLFGLMALSLFAYSGLRVFDLHNGSTLGVWLFMGFGWLCFVHALGFRAARMKGVLSP